jgi:hypothetical protein
LWTLIGASIFMGYWAFIGWIALLNGMPKLLNLAVIVIALRLLIVYVEVFGSLLQTGFGLIISGVVLIALVGATRKVMTALPRRRV